MKLPPLNEMETARRRRDGSYDGVFFVCVRTTGVFCLPSCPARTPQSENVEYASTSAEAVRVGYRPCKRCRPDRLVGHPPDWFARLDALVDGCGLGWLRDVDLRASDIEPACARRWFQKRWGMTFQTYQRARRMSAALAKLHQGATETDAATTAGYASSSGFRSAFQRCFGVTPGRSREVGMIVTQIVESPVGPIQLGATSQGICLLEFADRRSLSTEIGQLTRAVGPVLPGKSPHLTQMADELAGYFAGNLTEFTTPLHIARGTPFQRRVWERLIQVPFGETMSYGQLAKAINQPGAQRPVGSANGANCIAIVIPCHRIVQSDGQLRGYGGGLWRKRFLLDLEARGCGACLPLVAAVAPR
ncbi:MAG: methylated-DNA--[protein]-cysteine S-methyltransferase [bacterium]|nr:methylated-DNA--[protein]-cysteine S-methyltransferase [bacterium]